MDDIEEIPRHDNVDNHKSHSKTESNENPAWKCHHNSGAGVRNLVVCIDGTANQFGDKNTNVIELYHLIRKEVGANQLTWYNSGIGTYARPSWKSLTYYRQVIDHKIDLAIAWNFEQTILAAYRWLSDNYQEGDRIFLFGFSRGAFQVRVLAGMIDKVGLIHKGNEKQIPFAYQLYADPKLSWSWAINFKETFCQDKADVHFVGVWDTVSSIGIMRGKSMLPRTIDGMKHVCYFRHALALDERRVKFTPEYAYGGWSTSPPQPNAAPPNETAQPTPEHQHSTADTPPQTLEVWFPGTHSDIGGGNVSNETRDRNRPPLRWMVFESGAAGLRTKPFRRILLPSEQVEVKESLTGVWWILEFLPLARLTYTRRTEGKQTTYMPHLGKPRKMHKGQKIHGSFNLTDKEYTPKARPPDTPTEARPPEDKPDFWKTCHTEGLGNWKAVDLFEGTQDLVDRFVSQQDESVWGLLRRTARTVDGLQAVHQAMVKGLQSMFDMPDVHLLTKVDFIVNFMAILDQSGRPVTPLMKLDAQSVWEGFADIRKSDNERYIAISKDFLRRFTISKMDKMELSSRQNDVRNLIVCIDGTLNPHGEKKTNVLQLYDLIQKEVGSNQLAWYIHGIGADTRPRPPWESPSYIDSAFGRNIEDNILEAYWWLSDNYQKGDRIFLFGFSRGAFQVRILAAMIAKVGIIDKGHQGEIPRAYQYYTDPNSGPSAERFKKAMCYEADVHFVGAWDTVSSIGPVIFPGTIDGMKHVCYFRHALALDERRVKFGPEYAYGGSATGPSESNAPRPNGRAQRTQAHQNSKTDRLPHTLEVWFAGTHLDIGGGNVRNVNLDRSSPPFCWMVCEARAAGLRTNTFKRDLSPVELKESLKGFWRVLEFLPLRRLTYTRNEMKRNSITHKPHMGKPRKIHVGQKIHSSLISMDNRGYTPKARPIGDDPEFWTKFRSEGLVEWKADDLVDSSGQTPDNVGRVRRIDPIARAQELVDSFAANQDPKVKEDLQQLAMTGDGRQAVYDAMAGALQSILALPNDRLSTKVDFIVNFMDIFGQTGRQATPLTKMEAKPVWQGLADFRESENKDYIDISKKFLRRFTTAKPRVDVTMDQKQVIISVGVFPDGTSMVAALSDRTIRGWNAATGTPISEHFYEQTRISSVIVVTANGKLLISGSQDGTVFLWKGRTNMFPLKGHTLPVRSLSLSPDGKFVASGSEDKTIRIWDIDRRIQVGEPLTGHEDTVTAVGFSGDGRRVVSCSFIDKTVRMWDISTGSPIGPVPLSLGGEDSWLLSAALSSDGRHLAVGFSDEGVRIWDLEERVMLGMLFQTPEDDVYSLAFSPDNKKIVTGSNDGMVLIWDVETRKLENKFQYGARVRTVAFFPNGRQVVAGCDDGKIRIRGTEPWD